MRSAEKVAAMRDLHCVRGKNDEFGGKQFNCWRKNQIVFVFYRLVVSASAVAKIVKNVGKQDRMAASLERTIIIKRVNTSAAKR